MSTNARDAIGNCDALKISAPCERTVADACNATRNCENCKEKYDLKEKKCLKCGRMLKKQYTEKELKEIQKQNDDTMVINTLLM